MGIKGFSKTFAPSVIKMKDLKNLRGSFDASVILYQSALGMNSINGLTDSSGAPTLHINVIISRILNFIENNTGQVWVFDYYEKGYMPPNKELEILKRNARKEKAKIKIDELKSKSSDDLFSSDDETETKINQQEKIAFSVNDQIINDCIFILNCFDITWCISPKGVEAEQVCAELTNLNCDFVYSTDVDALLYGAKKLVRSVNIKGKKVLQSYELNNILENNSIDMASLAKISIILGSDHAEKTSGVGPKTVLKKYKNIVLSEGQTKALDVFKKPVDITSISFNNKDSAPLSNDDKIKELLDWLESRNFNRDRIKKQISKVRSFTE